jgi:hypothetical protein
MRQRKILIGLGVVAAMGIAVWILAGSGDIVAAIVTVLAVALAVTWGVRWGSAQARETEKYRQDLINKRRKSTHSPSEDAGPDSKSPDLP